MVERDTFTVSVKRQPVNTGAAALSLITQERNQKLELLIHLLANLPHSLVVCGPEGIGKSTLIKMLQERQNQSWDYCPVQGNAGLSFEAVQERLGQLMGLDRSQSLAASFNRYDAQHRKIVLIIDDAGTLVPGLITTIVQYTAAYPVLRVVFALTHDELHVLSQSDRVLDDCHVIEIPSLSEKQCGEFLLELSSQPYVPITQAAINEDLIETVYRDTHGVPGKIIEQIPVLSSVQQSNQSVWWMAAAVAVLVAVVLILQYSSSTIKGTPAPSVAESKPAESAITQPHSIETLPAAQIDKITPEPTPQPTAAGESLVIDQLNPQEPMVTVEIMPDQVVQPEETVKADTPPLTTPAPVVEKQSVESANVSSIKPTPITKKIPELSVVQEKKPLTETPEPVVGGYSLQLIVVSKQTSIDELKRKYPALSSSLRVVTFRAAGQERYALMYGSFDSAASANKARQSLPSEFRNALARKAGSP